MTSYFGRVFTHAGVLAVFKPRRGRLKIPVAPTGKLKLHVFPLRRAKENKGFSPLDTHNPLKRIDLNFFDRFPEGYRAISTNPWYKFLHFYPSLQILKKPLTNPSPGGIIDKLSRETRTQKARIERECSLKIVSMHNPDGKSLWSVAKSLLRSWKLPQKTFSKNFKKPLDKKETAWYNNKAVTKDSNRTNLWFVGDMKELSVWRRFHKELEN